MKVKTITCFLIIIAILSVFTACGVKNDEGVKSEETITVVKFNSELDYQKLDGKTVQIRGYMSTLSPPNGKFVYLMNVPYQSCPYCMPNTATVVNTVAVYAPEGGKFEFYDGPIEVTGTMKAGDITDGFGYNYPFRIVNAKFTRLSTAVLSKNIRIYGALTQENIINQIMQIGGQVNFNASFERFGGSAADIRRVKDEEIDAIISKIKAISATDYAELIKAIEELKAVNIEINKNIEAKEYAKNNDETIALKIDAAYFGILNWLNKFEI